jgi:hypothetical protein
MFEHPELQQKVGLQLEWPGAVDWIRPYSQRELLRLRPREDLAWFLTKDNKLECVEITNLSHRLHIKTPPELHGIQVFFRGCTVSGGPHLFIDGQRICLFKITDLEAAHFHYDKPTALEGKNIVDLKTVRRV